MQINNNLNKRLAKFYYKILFRYEEFFNCLQDNRNELTEWIDPVRNGPFHTPTTRKATQVFVILKEKANLK